MKRGGLVSALPLMCLWAAASAAATQPLGQPQRWQGLEITAAYSPPATIEPAHLMSVPGQADIHLIADIHALPGNPQGFPEGDWVPYLEIKYRLHKLDGGKAIGGSLVPAAGGGGPYYGDNVKLFGPGKYRLRYTLHPPGSADNDAGRRFARHASGERGVQPWFKPFSVEFEFEYPGSR